MDELTLIVLVSIGLIGSVYAWYRVWHLKKILKAHGWSENDE